MASDHWGRAGQRVNQPVVSMAINRGIELIAESLPQTCFQTFRIIQSIATNRAVSSLQYFTVGSSFAAIGFIFSIMVSCFVLGFICVLYSYFVHRTMRWTQASIFGKPSQRYTDGYHHQNLSVCSSSFHLCFTYLHILRCASFRLRCLCTHGLWYSGCGLEA